LEDLELALLVNVDSVGILYPYGNITDNIFILNPEDALL